MIALFGFLMAALIFWRLVLPLKCRWFWKCTAALVILAACLKMQIMHLLGGPNYFAPVLPGWFLLGSAWFYSVAFLLFFLLAAAEIVRTVVQEIYRFRRRPLPEAYPRILKRVYAVLLAVAVISATVGIAEGQMRPRIHELTLRCPALPASADGLRIALMADLHAHTIIRAPQIRQMVEAANALDPDLILIVGDFVDGTHEERGEELVPLKELRARIGVYGVSGNHEYYSGYSEWKPYLTVSGIRMLDDENVKLSSGIYLAGVTDPASTGKWNAPPDLDRALKGIPSGAFTVLMAHRPGAAADASRRNVALQLSGHTHGGMILGFDRIVARFNGGFVAGLYEIGGMKLYVSNGTGIWNGFPIRLGRPAEITLITLTR